MSPVTTHRPRSIFIPGLSRKIFISGHPEGFYRKWDNIANWNDAWQVQHRNFSDLIDLAQEPGTTNENFGETEGSTFPKIKFLRQPNNPEYYCYDANSNYVGFGPNNGLTTTYLQQQSDFYSEYVQDFLNRSARWLMDRTKADGLRLDAVKHVPADFFGARWERARISTATATSGRPNSSSTSRAVLTTQSSTPARPGRNQPARIVLRHGEAAAQRDDVRRASRASRRPTATTSIAGCGW